MEKTKKLGISDELTTIFAGKLMSAETLCDLRDKIQKESLREETPGIEGKSS